MIRNESSARCCLSALGFVVLVTLTACAGDHGSPGGNGGQGGSAGSGGVASGAGGVASGAGGGGASGAGGGGSSVGGAGSSGAGSGGGGTAGASGSSGACHEESESGPLTTRLPCVLSETGLYAADMVTLAQGVHPYSPMFELWSDDAAKKRWIALPAGTKIDTTDMNYWSFPTGTKLWKEFARDGVRVETRLIEKQASGSWYTVAYQWRADQKDADAVPNGVMNASGTQHDIPNNDQCLTCHSQLPDKVLGFSAIQLSREKSNPNDATEWTLGTLMADGLLTQPPAAVFSMPGTELERKLFGYLHANCGHCHNPKGTANSQTGLDMWLKVADMSGPVSGFSVYQDIVDADIAWLDGEHPQAEKRIASGSLTNSAVYQRFIKKAEAWSMPPLGTEVVDPTGKKLLEDWIGSL
jgi:hypothetical protein